jgi:hypothetical protein
MTKRPILFALSAILFVVLGLVLVTTLLGNTRGVRVILYNHGSHTELATASGNALVPLVEHAFETATGQFQLITLPGDIDSIRSTRFAIEVLFAQPRTLRNSQSSLPIRFDRLLAYIDDTSGPSPYLVIYYGINGVYQSGPYINSRPFDNDLMELMDLLTAH